VTNRLEHGTDKKGPGNAGREREEDERRRKRRAWKGSKDIIIKGEDRARNGARQRRVNVGVAGKKAKAKIVNWQVSLFTKTSIPPSLLGKKKPTRSAIVH
jgi:hypothetical protein